jgi:hypothetical protein
MGCCGSTPRAGASVADDDLAGLAAEGVSRVAVDARHRLWMNTDPVTIAAPRTRGERVHHQRRRARRPRLRRRHRRRSSACRRGTSKRSLPRPTAWCGSAATRVSCATPAAAARRLSRCRRRCSRGSPTADGPPLFGGALGSTPAERRVARRHATPAGRVRAAHRSARAALPDAPRPARLRLERAVERTVHRAHPAPRGRLHALACARRGRTARPARNALVVPRAAALVLDTVGLGPVDPARRRSPRHGRPAAQSRASASVRQALELSGRREDGGASGARSRSSRSRTSASRDAGRLSDGFPVTGAHPANANPGRLPLRPAPARGNGKSGEARRRRARRQSGPPADIFFAPGPSPPHGLRTIGRTPLPKLPQPGPTRGPHLSKGGINQGLPRAKPSPSPAETVPPPYAGAQTAAGPAGGLMPWWQPLKSRPAQGGCFLANPALPEPPPDPRRVLGAGRRRHAGRPCRGPTGSDSALAPSHTPATLCSRRRRPVQRGRALGPIWPSLAVPTGFFRDPAAARFARNRPPDEGRSYRRPKAAGREYKTASEMPAPEAGGPIGTGPIRGRPLD